MSYDNIDIADCSVIYLSYDEPQKEEFWLKIKNMCSWAVRVDGVKGSDAAHKAAGEASDTERFFLIDGDNLPNDEFFDLALDFTELDPSYITAQYRWRATNAINALCYGNGGISSWTKTYVREMKTHENSEGNPATTVDFCLDSTNNQYWSMHDCYSTTYPNKTPYQSWRAGFREGVKMSLTRGQKCEVRQFLTDSNNKNYDNLTIWHNVGADVDNGYWAMYGARLGTYMTVLTDWDHRDVLDFDKLKDLWQEHIYLDPKNEAELLGEELSGRLGLPQSMLNPEQSIFFKRHLMRKKRNLGPLTREMDVIRKSEGW